MDRLASVGRLTRELATLAWRVKAWWLPPLALILLGAAWLAATGQALAPFAYTFF
jgi:hypothetical protein